MPPNSWRNITDALPKHFATNVLLKLVAAHSQTQQKAYRQGLEKPICEKPRQLHGLPPWRTQRRVQRQNRCHTLMNDTAIN
ncbi:MAG: hypothetical protein EBQ68_01795 [Betaproteobacteria bacterium]|nr:hypothetical protein [Betaproteobacteria bacterium]NBY32822.1 hypothetical protein [Betaproteobacteria bacterium]